MKKLYLLATFLMFQVSYSRVNPDVIDRTKTAMRDTQREAQKAGSKVLDRLTEKSEFSEIRVAIDNCDLKRFLRASKDLSLNNPSVNDAKKWIELFKDMFVKCALNKK